MSYNLGKEPASLGSAISDKALLVQLEDGEEFWVLRVVVYDAPRTSTEENGKDGDLRVHQWWAEKNGR